MRDEAVRADSIQPRHGAYLDAVRILDRSPRDVPLVSSWGRLPEFPTIKLGDPPGRFKANVVARSIAGWRSKFPYLLSILYRYPPGIDDDAFDIHFRDDKIFVELETRVKLDICSSPHAMRPLSPSPTHSDMTIHHTIVIHFVNELSPRSPSNHSEWQTWLYHNKELDGRIVGATFPPYWHNASLACVCAFASSRRQANREPMTVGTISLSADKSRDPAIFEHLGDSFGPQLRRLDLRILDLPAVDYDWHSAIARLDAAFPRLEELSIVGLDRDTPFLIVNVRPLAGLPFLRRFTFHCVSWAQGADGTRQIRDSAAYVCRVGGPNCIYDNLKYGIQEYNDYVQDARDDLKNQWLVLWDFIQCDQADRSSS